MLPTMNYLTAAIIATGILAATFSITSGFSCYTCVYSDNTANGPAFEAQFSVPFTSKCLKPDGETTLVGGCKSTEQSCERVSMTVTADDVVVKVLLRECSEGSIQGEVCADISGSTKKPRYLEIVEKIKSVRALAGDASKFKGTGCTCGSDKCNSNPGTPGAPNKANHIQTSLPTNALAIWCLSLYFSSHSS